jgi:hypothetical protein
MTTGFLYLLKISEDLVKVGQTIRAFNRRYCEYPMVDILAVAAVRDAVRDELIMRLEMGKIFTRVKTSEYYECDTGKAAIAFQVIMANIIAPTLIESIKLPQGDFIDAELAKSIKLMIPVKKVEPVKQIKQVEPVKHVEPVKQIKHVMEDIKITIPAETTMICSELVKTESMNIILPNYSDEGKWVKKRIPVKPVEPIKPVEQLKCTIPVKAKNKPGRKNREAAKRKLEREAKKTTVLQIDIINDILNPIVNPVKHIVVEELNLLIEFDKIIFDCPATMDTSPILDEQNILDMSFD